MVIVRQCPLQVMIYELSKSFQYCNQIQRTQLSSHEESISIMYFSWVIF